MYFQKLTVFLALLSLVVMGAGTAIANEAATAAPAFAAGQKQVKICLPTTGSYTPQECRANFNPAGLCEADEEVKLDFCETYNPAPFCSLKGGQNGQTCGCYYFCKKKKKGPITPGNRSKAADSSPVLSNE